MKKFIFIKIESKEINMNNYIRHDNINQLEILKKIEELFIELDFPIYKIAFDRRDIFNDTEKL